MSFKQFPVNNTSSPLASMKGDHVAVRVPDFEAAVSRSLTAIDPNGLSVQELALRFNPDTFVEQRPKPQDWSEEFHESWSISFYKAGENRPGTFLHS